MIIMFMISLSFCTTNSIAGKYCSANSFLSLFGQIFRNVHLTFDSLIFYRNKPNYNQFSAV